MFGLRFKVVCPYCRREHMVSLGCATDYYKINNSEYSYTKNKCGLCKKEYWLNHTLDKVNDIKKIGESNKLDLICTINW